MRITAMIAVAALLSTSSFSLVHAGEAAPPNGMVEVPNAPPRPASEPPPGMVEIPNGETFERPRVPLHVPMTRRRALFITGGVVAGVGVLLTVLGVAGILDANHQSANCSGADLSCGLGSLGEALVGYTILEIGLPHAVAGLILVGVGAGQHR